MEKIYFIDGEDLNVFDGTVVKKFKSKYIENYRNTLVRISRSKSWKEMGDGAKFRGDVRYDTDTGVMVALSGIYAVSENKIAYSFTVENTAGFYMFDSLDEKSPESHIYTSVEEKFSGGMLVGNLKTIVTSVSRNYVNADIALIDIDSASIKTVTDGDTLDEDPYISPDDCNLIYFSSRGVGRDAHGDFVAYSPSAVMRLNLNTLELEELYSSEKHSFIKPKNFGEKIYAIRIPAKKKGVNPIIEILLLPWRILQALANFINVFVRAFTGKSLTSGGANPTKGREYDSREMYISGQLINAEKEYKRNIKKDKDGGYIPLDWQLIELVSGKVIKNGVSDYDITSDGKIVATNGKRIFAIDDTGSTRLVNVEKCTFVSVAHTSEPEQELFEL